MQAAGKHKDFSRLRRFLWPVHRYELKKLVPMLLIFFLLTFDYNILRCMKDTLVVTAENSGAEVIPFIKVWAMFPMSVVMTYIFIRLSNRFSREKVFYTMFSMFLLYYFIFTFFLYPAREQIHPHATADRLQAFLPEGMKGFVAMYRYWIFTSFYVMSELWGNIVLFLLFWGFANQINKIDEAKRFYGLFGIGTNFSGVAAGLVSIFVSQLSLSTTHSQGKDTWGESFTLIMSLVLVAGFLAIGVFRWLNKYALKDPRLAPAKEEVMQEQLKEQLKKEKTKPKFSMRENLKFLATSKYVLFISIIVIAYNVVINLVEILWKQEVLAFRPDSLNYNIFMSEITTYTGIVATLISVLLSGNSIRKFGWTFTAMITPTILLITSVGFFGFFFLKSRPDIVLGLFGASPLAIAVFFGSLQNVLSRASKYTVFDATKEMAFVPLKPDEKIKSKAAIDGVCNRLGKSGGSVIYQVLLLWLSSITACVPYVAICLFGIIAIWMLAVKNLGKEFHELTTTVQPEQPETSSEVTAAAAAPAAA